MSLEMAHKVILPPKKNYIPQFLKQRDINSYCPNYVQEFGLSRGLFNFEQRFTHTGLEPSRAPAVFWD
jgi:hypothetical protein